MQRSYCTAKRILRVLRISKTRKSWSPPPRSLARLAAAATVETGTITAAPPIAPRQVPQDIDSARSYLETCLGSCTKTVQSSIMEARRKKDPNDRYCNNYGNTEKDGDACFCGNLLEDDVVAARSIGSCVQTECTQIPDDCKKYLGIASDDWSSPRPPSVVKDFVDQQAKECLPQVNMFEVTMFPGRLESMSASTTSTETSTAEASTTESPSSSSASSSRSPSSTGSASLISSSMTSSLPPPTSTSTETSTGGATTPGRPDGAFVSALFLGGLIGAFIYII